MFTYFIPLTVNLTQNSKLEKFVHEQNALWKLSGSSMGALRELVAVGGITYSARICANFIILWLTNQHSDKWVNHSVYNQRFHNQVRHSDYQFVHSNTKSSTVMEIDIVIQQVMEFVGMGTGNRYTLLLLCANFGDIHLYLICTILGSYNWWRSGT